MLKMCSMNMVWQWQQKFIVVVVAMMAVLVFVVAEQRSRSPSHRKEESALIAALTSSDHLPQQPSKTQPMARQMVSTDNREKRRQIRQNEDDFKVNEDEKTRMNPGKKKPKIKKKKNSTPRRKIPPYIRRVLPVNEPIKQRVVGRGRTQKTECGQTYRVGKGQDFRIRLSKRKLCNNIFRAAKGAAFQLFCTKLFVGNCNEGELFLSDGATVRTKYCSDNSSVRLKTQKLMELILTYKPSESSGINITKPDVTCKLRGRKGTGYSAVGNQQCPLSCGQTLANAEADKKPDALSTTITTTTTDEPLTVSGVGINLTTIPPLIPNPANASLGNPSNVSPMSNGKYLGRVSVKVQGGKDADIGEWPWIVYIKIKVKESPFICGGTIITPQHILTAAHCVFDLNLARGDTIKVIANEYNIEDKDETTKQMSFVSKISLHPRYDSSTQNADIAVLHLSKTLTFGPGLAPVCFAPAGNYDGSKVVILGWGSLSNDGGDPVVLQEAQQMVDNIDECAKNYTNGEYPVTHKHVCASSPGIDSCIGDSGGPLLVQIGTSWYQLGIVSYGKDCALPGFPGVNTLVSSYVSWILKKIRKSTCY